MKASIITVNLNNLNGLRRTMQSVLLQERSLFEWIIIDGGSTDGSLELIMQHKDEIDYWVSEPDKGIYNAMNKGIAVARGDYLLFLNSGDCFLSNTILQDVFSHDFKEDIIFGSIRRASDGRSIDSLTLDNPSLIDLWNKPFPHQGMFIKTSLFERFGLYDESLHIISDWVFSLKAIIYGGCTMRFLQKDIAYFEGGGVSSVLTHREEERKVFIEKIPPRLFQTMLDAMSKQEICYNTFFSRLYSILYRTAIFFRYKLHL